MPTCCVTTCEPPTLAHGRIEQRAIWTTTRLNDYLNFPGVGQAFVIERDVIEKTTGKRSTATVYGLTDHTPDSADAAAILAFNRRHWTIENSCHYLLGWHWDEDRAPSAPVMAPRTSPPYAASPAAPSSRNPAIRSLPPSNAWRATSAGCSTTWV